MEPLSPNTPWYADKPFLLVIFNLVALLALQFFGVELNTEVLVADVSTVLGYVAGNKVKSGAALVALIKAKAEDRYVKPPDMAIAIGGSPNMINPETWAPRSAPPKP